MKVGDVLMVNTAAVKSSSARGSELRMKEGCGGGCGGHHGYLIKFQLGQYQYGV